MESDGTDVAPLYFKGEIEFGVINQSSSAFSHILGDVSLVVYQIERLASFSAVTDRLGQMTEVLNGPASRLVAPWVFSSAPSSTLPWAHRRWRATWHHRSAV